MKKQKLQMGKKISGKTAVRSQCQARLAHCGQQRSKRKFVSPGIKPRSTAGSTCSGRARRWHAAPARCAATAGRALLAPTARKNFCPACPGWAVQVKLVSAATGTTPHPSAVPSIRCTRRAGKSWARCAGCAATCGVPLGGRRTETPLPPALKSESAAAFWFKTISHKL